MWAPIIKYLQDANFENELKKKDMAKLMAMVRYTSHECGLHVILEGNWSLVDDYLADFEYKTSHAILSKQDKIAAKKLLEYLSSLGPWDSMGFITKTQNEFIQLSDKYYVELIDEMTLDDNHLVSIPNMESYKIRQSIQIDSQLQTLHSTARKIPRDFAQKEYDLNQTIQKIKQLQKKCDETIQILEKIK